MAFVDLVKNDDVISTQRGVRGDLPEQKAFCQEQDLGPVGFPGLEPDLVPDFIPELVEGLIGDTIGQGNAGNASGLGAGHVPESGHEEILGDLS